MMRTTWVRIQVNPKFNIKCPYKGQKKTEWSGETQVKGVIQPQGRGKEQILP